MKVIVENNDYNLVLQGNIDYYLPVLKLFVRIKKLVHYILVSANKLAKNIYSKSAQNDQNGKVNLTVW